MNKVIFDTPRPCLYRVYDVHPGVGRKRGLIAELTIETQDPGATWVELQKKYNGNDWNRRFIFGRGKNECRYRIEYSY